MSDSEKIAKLKEIMSDYDSNKSKDSCDLNKVRNYVEGKKINDIVWIYYWTNIRLNQIMKILNDDGR